jgi:hypothetical protein
MLFKDESGQAADAQIAAFEDSWWGKLLCPVATHQNLI